MSNTSLPTEPKIALSFSIRPSRPKPDVPLKVHGEEQKAESISVTSLSADTLEKLQDKKGAEDIVIPLQAKVAWRKKKMPRYLVEDEDDEEKVKVKKEEESSQIAQGGSLQDQAVASLLAEGREKARENTVVPILMQNAVPGSHMFATETDKVKHDVSMRPDESTLDDYDRVPIDSFGKGMLLGMGWKPGDAIGKSNPQCVDPIEFLSRPGRLGLGAKVTLPGENSNKILKPGESRVKEQLRVAPGADGHVRHFRSINERLIPVHSLRLRNNALIEIQTGSHRGLYGRIQNYETGKTDDNAISVILNINEEVVVIPKDTFQILDEHALPHDHPAFRKGPPPKAQPPLGSKNFKKSKSKSKSRSRSRDRDRDRDRSRSRSPKQKKRRSREKEKEKQKKPKKSKDDENVITWVKPHIRVRIISQSLSNGKYYNKKAKVEDVVSLTQFTLVTDDGAMIENVKQKAVESVIPKPPKGRVLILQGKHKGEIGTLLEKNAKKAKGVVQLDSDLEAVPIKFDDMSEWLG